MKTKLCHLIAAMTLLSTLLNQLATAYAQGTAFTYQGALSDGGSPANGSYDLRFALYDALSGGAQQGDTLTNAATTVSNGLFTVTLDFGNQFPGTNRWLELAVRTNGGGAFSLLTPRQQLLPNPYAIYAGNAGSAATAGSVPAASIGAGTANINISGNAATATTATTAVNFSGSLAGDVTGTQGATLASANFPRLNGTNVFTGTNRFAGVAIVTNVNNQFSGNGGGLTNLNSTNLIGTIADGRLSSNVALLNGTNVFTGTNRFAGRVIATNVNNQFTGTFTGDGAGMTNLNVNATNFNGVAKLAGGNTFSGDQIFGSGAINVFGSGLNGNTFQKFALFADTANGMLFEAPLDASNNKLPYKFSWRASSPAMVIATDGNVGIGTTTPPHKFDVNWGTTANFASFGDVHGSGPLLYLSTTPANGTVSIQSRNGHDLIFTSWPGGGGTQNELMRIKGNGSVGIGTATPSSFLDVRNGATIGGGDCIAFGSGGYDLGRLGEDTNILGNNVYLNNTRGTVDGSLDFRLGGASQMTIRGNGTASNVGIGTTAPHTQLTISQPGVGGQIALADPVNDPTGYWKMCENAIFNQRWGVLRYQYDNSPTGSSFSGAGFIMAPSGDITVYGEVSCVAVNLTSDRDAKKDFQPIKPREVLAKVANLPISEWQYKQDKNDTPARHIGPVAQDFSAAFALGHDDKHISMVDAAGVALAAIQGLNEKVEEKDARIQQLEQTVTELKELVTKLAAQQNGGSR